MKSDREILFWGSGLCFGMAWIIPITSSPGIFIIPLVMSFIFLFIGMRINLEKREVIDYQSKEDIVEAEDVVGVPI